MLLLIEAFPLEPLATTALRLEVPLWASELSSVTLLPLPTVVLVQLPGKLPLSKPSLKSTFDVLLPVPLRVTECGLPLALSVIVTLALRVPVVVGANVTLMVQEAPAAKVFGLIGHVFVWAKSLALVPPRPIVLMVRAAVPLFLSVTVCAALVVPTC